MLVNVPVTRLALEHAITLLVTVPVAFPIVCEKGFHQVQRLVEGDGDNPLGAAVRLPEQILQHGLVAVCQGQMGFFTGHG